ncbi:MAG: DUF1232 domain-containing protein [Solirubrobacteraceae bacterium]|nr:DUF1232 domain-containing protein [Solirubrobacteraceae bacterium]
MGDVLLKALLAVVVLYGVVVAAVWWYARRAEPATLREAASFGPDLVRLVRGLLAGGGFTRRARVALGALLLYLALPIDLVPDPIPLIGWADDLVLVVLVLRGVTRRAGTDVIRAHWPGGPAGLAVLLRLLRLS